MNLLCLHRFGISGWAVLLALATTLSIAPAWGTSSNPQLAQRLYQAIEQSQIDDPSSYFSPFDFQRFNLSPLSTNEAMADENKACAGLPTHGTVYGSTQLDGQPLDYEIDFHDLLVKVDYLGESHILKAADLIDFQRKDGWPCAVPVAAVVCAIGGGAFCGWRIAQCYRAAENCPCGVAVYNCGVCGEGSGVRCRECTPRDRRLPDLRPIFEWPVEWGY